MSPRESPWTSRSQAPSAATINTDRRRSGAGLSPRDNVEVERTATPGTQSGSGLSDRERAILLALDDYRYLDRSQLEALFFSGSRTAQLKLRELTLRQLVLRWDRRLDGEPAPRPSIYVLTARGAAALSRAMQLDPRPATTRARRAQTQTYHLLHDVEANGFFAGIAAAAAALPDRGLYHWAGESRCRQVSGEHGSPASDGWGRYLMPHRELLFDLEWDRGTEHERRLRQKATTYVSYFHGLRGARLRHVLIVTPTDHREAEVRRVFASALPQAGECCRFWTTTLAFLQREGPLGRIWLEVGSRAPGFVAFDQMPGSGRSDRRVEDCIGKPGWWERRPGGGEGA